MGGGSLKEFYLDLNPLTLLQSSGRDFAETMILFGYMVVFAIFSYKITMILVERIKPAPDAVHEYNRRKVARMGFLMVFGIAYLPYLFFLVYHSCLRSLVLPERGLSFH